MAEPLELVLGQSARLAGVEINHTQSLQLVAYLETLSTWNGTINLTSLDLRGFPEQTLARLAIEPLQGVGYLPTVPFCWFDLGSGGGSPAVPLRVAAPHGLLTMVESRGRKAAFLREVVRVCGLEGVSVVTARIEDLPTTVPAGSVDVFTLRAVRLDDSVANVISKLGAPDVKVLLFGPVDWSSMGEAFAAASTNKSLTMLVRRVVPRGTTEG